MSDAIFFKLPRCCIYRTQQNLTEYWREFSTSTAISPTSSSDVVGQHNKIGGINFGTILVYIWSHILCLKRTETIELCSNWQIVLYYVYYLRVFFTQFTVNQLRVVTV